MKKATTFGAIVLGLCFAAAAFAVPKHAHAHVYVFAGAGQMDGGDHSQLDEPAGLAVTADGRVLITNMRGHNILCVTPSGETPSKVFAGCETRGDNIDPDSPRATELSLPRILSVHRDGGVLIPDTHNHRILRVSPDGGSIKVVAGGAGRGDHFEADDPLATQLNHPTAVAVAADGAFLIADANNHRILRVSPDGGSIKVVAGGAGRGDHFEAGNPLATQLSVPRGLAVVPDGSILIADTENHRILRVSPDGESIKVVAGGMGHPGVGQLDAPQGLAVFGDWVLIADTGNHRILAVHKDGNRVEIVAGGQGRGNRINPTNPRDNQLNAPQDIAVAADGSILIADTGNHRVLLIGTSDNFEKKLNSLISTAVGEDALAAGRAESDLRLLAGPVGNLLKVVDRRNAGLEPGEDPNATERRRQQLSGVAERNRPRLVAALPSDVLQGILAHANDPVQAFWRSRARNALRIVSHVRERRKQLADQLRAAREATVIADEDEEPVAARKRNRPKSSDKDRVGAPERGKSPKRGKGSDDPE